MKIAPKRYVNGGGVSGDPKKKKKEGVLTPNPDYPSANVQLAEKGLINPTTAKILDITQQRTGSGGITTGKQAVLGIQSAGGLQKEVLPLVQNELGTYDPNTGFQYDKSARIISKTPIQGKAKGGEVKKMKIAPKRGKKNC